MDAVAARSDPLRPETSVPSWRKRAGAPPKRPTPAILAPPDPPPDNSTPTGCYPASLTRVRCIGALIERKFFCDKGLTFKQRKSPMPPQCNPNLFAFAPAEGRPVVVSFDGGAITSDASALLLGATDRVLGLTRRLAACFKDSRNRAYTEHTVETLVMQRVVGLALGYEDLNDHDQIRHDPVLATLATKLTASRSECAPLAGKSTLNRLELSRDEPTRYARIVADSTAIEALFVDLFLDAHAKAPAQITL